METRVLEVEEEIHMRSSPSLIRRRSNSACPTRFPPKFGIGTPAVVQQDTGREFLPDVTGAQNPNMRQNIWDVVDDGCNTCMFRESGRDSHQDDEPWPYYDRELHYNDGYTYDYDYESDYESEGDDRNEAPSSSTRECQTVSSRARIFDEAEMSIVDIIMAHLHIGPYWRANGISCASRRTNVGWRRKSLHFVENALDGVQEMFEDGRMRPLAMGVVIDDLKDVIGKGCTREEGRYRSDDVRTMCQEDMIAIAHISQMIR